MLSMPTWIRLWLCEGQLLKKLSPCLVTLHVSYIYYIEGCCFLYFMHVLRFIENWNMFIDIQIEKTDSNRAYQVMKNVRQNTHVK